MLAKVQKWGNSQGLRLPKHVLETSAIAVGDQVEVTAEADQIVIKKTKRKFDLAEMVSRMPKGHRSQEESFGKPVGKEVW
ncbi:MAG TPA: AbrB/MazE/SpoVT family DNA-binding domain-containing protein [Candidatus Acidoferrum sp.]|nr:AbrB/MazE/SpoVT family DNA-binding domain-containing protein [Candidatus Acidoferrum sp.]